MKHSKHSWYLRHQINEALRNRVQANLTFAEMQDCLRNGLVGTDTLFQLIHQSVGNVCKDNYIVSSGCGDDYLVFVLVKRE